MLPSSGYFRSVNCPFFESGLCERPHCHFRHVKKDPVPVARPRASSAEDAALSSLSMDASKPDLLQLVSEAVRKMKEQVAETQPANAATLTAALTNTNLTNLFATQPPKKDDFPYADLPSATGKTYSVAAKNPSDNISHLLEGNVVGKYSPEHVSPEKLGIVLPNNGGKTKPVLEYKPTPIAQLKKMQQENKYMKAAAEMNDDSEYDPVSNYSAGLPAKKKKVVVEYTPRCVTPGILKRLPPASLDALAKKRVKFSLSDEEASDVESKPRKAEADFSDDEDDESENTPSKCLNETLQAIIEDETGKAKDEKVKEKADANASCGKFDVIDQILCESKKSELAIKNNSKAADNAANVPREKVNPLLKKTAVSNASAAVKKEKVSGKKKSVKFSDSTSEEEKKSNKKGSILKHSISKEKKTEKPIADKTDKPKTTTKTDKTEKKPSVSKSKDAKHSSSPKKHTDKKKSDEKSQKASSDKSKSRPASNTKSRHENKSVKLKSKCHDSKSSCHKPKLKTSDKDKHAKLKKPQKTKVVLSSSDSDDGPVNGSFDGLASDSDDSSTTFKTPQSPLKTFNSDSERIHASFRPVELDADDVDTDLDEHDTYEECLKIFNEYVPPKEDSELVAKKLSTKFQHTESEESTLAKRRIAHSGIASNKQAQSRVSLLQNPVSKVSPAQTMFNRYAKIQKMAEELPKVQTPPPPPPAPSSFLSSVNLGVGKKRIAHVPNVTALINATNTAKSKIPSSVQGNANNTDSTVSQTVPKGASRVAHVPKALTMPRPVIPIEYGSKVPSNVRQRYLNSIIDECLKIYDSEQDAFDRALSEEKNAYDRSTSRNVYLNVAINTIKRLRNEQAGLIPANRSSSEEQATTVNLSSSSTTTTTVVAKPVTSKRPVKTFSHQSILGGKNAANTSYSIERPRNAIKDTNQMSGILFYKLLQCYILTIDQLEKNNFPRQDPLEHGRAIIMYHEKKKSISSLERICCRCGARYRVSSKGTYITKEECYYHWSKAYKRRIAGSIENRYSCCQGDLQSEGCCVAKLHVSEIDCTNLTGFVSTLPKTPPIDGNYGVFALDCEMCYTVNGTELTRVTVVGQNMKPVYETLVIPDSPIIDYNTRFSGITEKDMIGVTTKIRDVQAVLLSKFSDKTILIGHSLESDFKALKLIHDTVVDTSQVFPHRLGPPYKRALRNLTVEYLKKIIQNSVEGHDSQEDAVACMELMMYKVKEDYKKIYR